MQMWSATIIFGACGHFKVAGLFEVRVFVLFSDVAVGGGGGFEVHCPNPQMGVSENRGP